ncbi:hypothetical protein BDFB_005279 [Asbolus verrucosus]|uniref:Uncharacterized protein n=1 Tax=Asbolus verrucosus TaxID=1661398 RepID=A0A482VCV5_ASBVE|nr:hypothetical protein BDFB_005279 [Asbolus verrucosus]
MSETTDVLRLQLTAVADNVLIALKTLRRLF